MKLLARIRAWWADLMDDGLNHDWDGPEPFTDDEWEIWEKQARDNEKRFYAGEYNRFK